MTLLLCMSTENDEILSYVFCNIKIIIIKNNNKQYNNNKCSITKYTKYVYNV